VRAIAQKLGAIDSMLCEWRRLYAPRPSVNRGAPQTLERHIRKVRVCAANWCGCKTAVGMPLKNTRARFHPTLTSRQQLIMEMGERLKERAGK
jgi:hypothetical protein